MNSGNLDPGAEEFRPTFHPQITLLHPQVYYPTPPPVPYVVGGVGYPAPAQAYVRLTSAPYPPFSATPTRTLLLSSVPNESTESTVRNSLQVFGEIRAVDMERLFQESILTVHYYDLRHAQSALVQIREQHMQHYSNPTVVVSPPGVIPGLINSSPVWAQFGVPAEVNQGTIVLFNLDSGVSATDIKALSEAFGAVKELRETPSKKNQRFVEFFDTRDAARAVTELDGKEINGKRLLVEFSRPGGHRRRFNTINNNPNINHYFNPINPNFYTKIGDYPQPLLPPQLPLVQKPFDRSVSDASSSSNSSAKPHNSVKSSVVVSPMGSSSPKKVKKGENKKLQQGVGKNGGRSNRCNFKGKSKSVESCFYICEGKMVESNYIRDPRTTVMIKNIPNKYSQKLLLNMLDNHCNHCNQQIGDDQDQPLSSYDFVYLPIDFNNKCNVGYGFVNLTSPQATLRFYKAFHQQRWEVFNTRKICEVTYARLQGLEALKEHFKNSKFSCVTDEYLPVVFSPPRDGKHATEPMAIGNHAAEDEEVIKKINEEDEEEDDEILVDEASRHLGKLGLGLERSNSNTSSTSSTITSS
ncbi:hypothetical protein GIB67_004472 [Kingdonia uniflora]|uniref:RRM domain-containing protein n=1 Tax=Kingdonia uniflora TaxID=39325 RepID=A0A7J7MRQ4_9MAGN|nr:hypothetical protein GIB67_004472 [Kingdonia uniflora]